MRALLLRAFACAAAASAAGARAEAPFKVATLTSVLTYVAREVGGRETRVTGLVLPGVDPHTFNPSPADVRELVDADVVLASGLDLEPYLARTVANAGLKGRILNVGDALPLVLSTPGGERDPHWWHSIDDTTAAVEEIRKVFDSARPESAERFDLNARVLERRLFDLKAWVRKELEALPPDRRRLVTSHDAFGYFAHDYGFTIYPVVGLSTDSEADARQVAALVDAIRRYRIGAVFVENGTNPRLIRNLLDETGARLGGMLYADGLGTADSDAATYEGMVRHNVEAIVDGLRPVP